MMRIFCAPRIVEVEIADHDAVREGRHVDGRVRQGSPEACTPAAHCHRSKTTSDARGRREIRRHCDADRVHHTHLGSPNGCRRQILEAKSQGEINNAPFQGVDFGHAALPDEYDFA